MSPRLNGDFVSTEIAWAASGNFQLLGSLDLWCNRGNNCSRYLLLYCKDVLQHAVVALRPDVAASQCVDKLGSHTNPIRRPADAALQHIAHAEVPADLPDVRRLALV